MIQPLKFRTLGAQCQCVEMLIIFPSLELRAELTTEGVSQTCDAFTCIIS